MDPDETLAQMRQFAQSAAEGRDVARSERELRWLFTELDAWITKGGFPPRAWTDHNRVRVTRVRVTRDGMPLP